ncbi:uncharacterized protein LOC130138838 [Syzygium oleosum]|uniref:uncharacterized protein LOC130138838 n=1 Tax=Syzygium oleosum TaxID=219896 RepID=UPI0024BAD273|nr:uncharacterized protein LOC130138838 [Syzygium oleosum]
MGCGVSRFNREDAASGPTYLYINPLHRRIEDFAFRRRGDRASATAGASLGDGGTASSKQLLYVDPDDADADSSSLGSNHKLDGGGGRKSVSSPCPLQNDAAAPALLPPPTRMNEPPVQVMEAKECSSEDGSEEVIKVVREVGEGGKGQGGGEGAVEEVVKEVVMAEKERGSGVDRKGEDKDEDEEDAGGISDREDSILLYPGSPSFREYCVLCFDESGDAEDDSTTKDADGKSDTAKADNETEKANMSTSDSVEVPKKSRRRRRFRVPRQCAAGGMRSLLHVSSCSPRRSFSKTA